jgi:hypothetical protein
VGFISRFELANAAKVTVAVAEIQPVYRHLTPPRLI